MIKYNATLINIWGHPEIGETAIDNLFNVFYLLNIVTYDQRDKERDWSCHIRDVLQYYKAMNGE